MDQKKNIISVDELIDMLFKMTDEEAIEMMSRWVNENKSYMPLKASDLSDELLEELLSN